MSYTWYTKGSGLDFDSHESYVNYTDNIHSQTGVAFNCGTPNVIKNIDNLTDFYIGFTVYYARNKPGPYDNAWNWLKVTGNDTAFINGSDNYLCCMPDSNGYKPPYQKGLSHIIVHVDTVNDKIEYWHNFQKVYTRESAGIAGKSYTAIKMCPTGGGANYAQRDNAISDLIITTEKTELDKYISKFSQSVSLTFDGSTNYAKIPVSLTDVSDWSTEITFTTTENRTGSYIYNQRCIFGYDTANNLSRDFHVDTNGGNLYVFNGLGNSSTPVGGTATLDNGDYGINTGIKVNDGKKHTVKAISTTGKIEVYCDGVLATTVYPATTLSADAVYIGCSMPAESIFGQLALYSFNLTKNGSLVAEYAPTKKEALLKTLTDNSGSGNDAALYGNTYACTVVTEDIDFLLSADTSRAVQTTTIVNADTSRMVAAHLEAFDISADADRTVYRAEIVGSDTERTIQTTTTVNVDAARKTVLPFAISVDTRRQFGMSFNIGVDTSRTVEATTTVKADISRAVEKTVAASFDAMRAMQAPFSLSADTARKFIVAAVKLDTDTLRAVERTETVNGDSMRYLVFDMDKLLIPANQPPAQGEFTPFPANPPKAATKGVISMTLELATGTLSDTLNIETFGTDFTPRRVIRGTFLDYPYESRVEQVTTTGARQKITSMSYIDRLLYVPLKFHADDGSTGDNFNDLANALAGHLGYACETHLENIYLTTNYTDTSVTYSSVMSGAFGWLSDLPWRQVNAYIKDGTMHFVQRGQEPTVYDITNLHHDEPTIVQKVYRSRFSPNNKKTKSVRSVHTAGFTGRVAYPDGGYTDYANGQPILSERSTESASVLTRWEYDMNGKLIAQSSHTTPRKDGVNPSETHTRLYYYTPTIGSGFMITETRTRTTETDSKTGKSTTTETVNYSESGKNSTTSTTMRDGDMVVSNGPVGTSTASEYAVNQQNIVMTGGATKWLDDDGNEVKDEADISLASLPVNAKPSEGVQLSELSAEINNHDRCTQETVEMNIIEPVRDGIPALTHVINFGERIKYNGNEYSLEHNTVTRTAREIKQSITITRWF
jgi:hypothetical protein